MISTKRSRGRPRGSGKNDIPPLMRVADLLIDDPSLKPTAAMKQVIRSCRGWHETDETLLRRWQGKWKENGHSLLAAARERAKPKPRSASRPSSMPFGRGGPIADPPFMKLVEQQQRVMDMIDPPALRAIRAMEERACAVQIPENVLRLIEALDHQQRMAQAHFSKHRHLFELGNSRIFG